MSPPRRARMGWERWLRVASLLVVITWIASGCVGVGWEFKSGAEIGVWRGSVYVLGHDFPVSSTANGLNTFGITSFRLEWWPYWGPTGVGWNGCLPLWILALGLLAQYGLVRAARWLADRAAEQNLCARCGYDGSGLDAAARCPECGAGKTGLAPTLLGRVLAPHPTVRAGLKWGGAVLSIGLLLVWLGSGWLWISCSTSGTGQAALCRGIVIVRHDDKSSGSAFGSGVHASVGEFDLQWDFSWSSNSLYWHLEVPLWCPAFATLALTAVIWRAERSLSRSAPGPSATSRSIT